MPNTHVPADGGALPAVLPTANAPIATEPRAVTCLFVAVRPDDGQVVFDQIRGRHDIEALIARLIDCLDQADADDFDREPFDEGDTLDEYGEAVNEDGDPLDKAELDEGSHDLSTQAETYGRGWGVAAVEAAERENLFSDAVRPALFISWKAGRCASAAFVPSEGRARA